MAISHKQQLKKKQKKQKKQNLKMKPVLQKPISSRPIISAWESEYIDGMVSIAFARKIKPTEYHICFYLLDTWALGVKDSFMRRLDSEQYDELIESASFYKRTDPAKLKKLVQASSEFGKKNGILPNGSYKRMLPYIENIAIENSEPLSTPFGNNGKVTYIANPDEETSEEIKYRLLCLTKTLGIDGFEYVGPDYTADDEANSIVKFYEADNAFDLHECPSTNNAKAIYTTTGEPHMAVRLYYSVRNAQALSVILNKLKCVSIVDRNTFHINYEKETRDFGLSKSYKQVPKDLFPIILGTGTFRDNNSKLTIDIRSYRRATSMLTFIDKRISRDILFLDEMATCNEITTNSNFCFDKAFKEVEQNNYETTKQKINKIENNSELSSEEKNKHIAELLDNDMTDQLPAITKEPTKFYSTGIIAVEMYLSAREKIAIEHIKGNKDFNFANLLNDMIGPVDDEFEEINEFLDSVDINGKTFCLDDSIEVFDDLICEFTNTNYKNWSGRIIDIFIDSDQKTYVAIEWDSVTINRISEEYKQYCQDRNLPIYEQEFSLEDMSKICHSTPKDTQEETNIAIEELIN